MKFTRTTTLICELTNIEYFHQNLKSVNSKETNNKTSWKIFDESNKQIKNNIIRKTRQKNGLINIIGKSRKFYSKDTGVEQKWKPKLSHWQKFEIN